MGAYDSAIASARRIIAAKGELCVWTEPAEGTVDDPAKPWIVTPGAPVAHDVSIAFLPMDRRGYELIRFMRGSDVVVGSEYGLMAAVSFAPGKKGVVTRADGSTRAVENIEKLAPSGEAIIYTITFAK